MSLPTSRFLRVRSYVAGWGAGQWWVDAFGWVQYTLQLVGVLFSRTHRVLFFKHTQIHAMQ